MASQEPAFVYTVSQLNTQARELLMTSFPRVWVEGELSNVSKPSSGHWYFTLKDGGAQIRCAMFRTKNLGVNFSPKDGQQILVQAQVSLYAPRGDYQLVVSHMEEAGVGKLQREFEKLKTELAKRGWFDEAHKKPLPGLPKKVGVITSPTGAAIRDILSVAKRRFPGIPVHIYPCSVQGEQATAQIVSAIEHANQDNTCDVIILSRGGGSLEDLWCFNEERVAKAIFDSELPIVSGVGHEIDFTIADFVADLRAPTPSAAAETVFPDHSEFQQRFEHKLQRLVLNFKKHLHSWQQHVLHLRKALRHPKERLQDAQQQLDSLEKQLWQQWQHHFERKQLAFKALGQRLHLVSPLATLDRGYAIVSNHAGKVVKSISQVTTGENIRIKISDGELSCEVTDI